MSKEKAVKKSKQMAPWLYDVIVSPVVTEKSQVATENGKVVFNVAIDSDKGKVKQAVEAIFGVTVEKVNILVNKGKSKKFRGVAGRRKDVKRAVVTLAKGQNIDIAGAV